MDKNRRPGSYYACYAEKQVMAYFLWKHMTLQDEVTDDSDEDEELEERSIKAELDPAILEQLHTYSGFQLVASLSAWQRYQNSGPYSTTLIQRLITGCQTLVQQYGRGLCVRIAQQERVKREVQSALSKVHFTVDLWTSPNALAILGIIAHYTSESGQLEHTVLALRELDGKHSGHNIASCIMQAINDYGIASKVGYFMMDNADNNDKMMEALSMCIYKQFIGQLYSVTSSD
jgi:hypothetical protein